MNTLQTNVADLLPRPVPAAAPPSAGPLRRRAAALLRAAIRCSPLGRRVIWNWGLIALAAALLLDSLARSVEMLVAFRILQAVGATMVYAAGPAIVTEAFSSHQRGRALGIMTTGGQVGMAVGPLLGGWLVATFGWPAIFWVRAPIALTIGLLSFWVIRDLTKPLRPRRPRHAVQHGIAVVVGVSTARFRGAVAGRPLQGVDFRDPSDRDGFHQFQRFAAAREAGVLVAQEADVVAAADPAAEGGHLSPLPFRR